MGCTFSKINKVGPAEITPRDRKGRVTDFRLWVGKKRQALFQHKVRKNQVMPLSQSSDEVYPTSSHSTQRRSSRHTTTSLSSSSHSTTISSLSNVSDPINTQTAKVVIEDRCRTRIIRKGSRSYHSENERSESSVDSCHGNFESRDPSPILFSSPTGDSIRNSRATNQSISPIRRLPLESFDDTSLRRMITAKEGSEIDDEGAEHLMRFAKAEVMEMKERRHRLLQFDSDDDEDEKTVNLDGILTVTPLRPPTPPAQRQTTGLDKGKAVPVSKNPGPSEEDKEPKYANSTEELEAVINETFEKYNLKMPEEEWKLEEKTYDDPDEELTDVIRQIFERWNLTMPDEESDVRSTSRAATRTSQPSTSSARDVSVIFNIIDQSDQLWCLVTVGSHKWGPS